MIRSKFINAQVTASLNTCASWGGGLAFTGEGYRGFGKGNTGVILTNIGIGAAGNYGIGKAQGLFGIHTTLLKGGFVGTFAATPFNFLGTILPASVEESIKP